MPKHEPEEIAQAWAILEDGVINLKTVYDHRRGAIVNWLCIRKGLLPTNATPDEVIFGLWELHKGNAEAVEVLVMIRADRL